METPQADTGKEMDFIAVAAVELKTKGLISEDVEIAVKDVSASKMLPIYATPSKKRIICSRDLQTLNGHALHVCLLHEHAHILLYPRFRMWLFLISFIWVAALIILLNGLLIRDLAFILTSVAAFLLGRFVYGVITYRYELAADYQACQSFKVGFNVKYPSEELRSALLALTDLLGSRHPKVAYLLKVLGYSHPTISERVSRIAATLDEAISTV